MPSSPVGGTLFVSTTQETLALRLLQLARLLFGAPMLRPKSSSKDYAMIVQTVGAPRSEATG